MYLLWFIPISTEDAKRLRFSCFIQKSIQPSVGPAKVDVSVPARKSCRFSLRKNLAGSPVPDYGLLRAARMV